MRYLFETGMQKIVWLLFGVLVFFTMDDIYITLGRKSYFCNQICKQNEISRSLYMIAGSLIIAVILVLILARKREDK